MNTKNTITSIIVAAGLAASIQTVGARELPRSLSEFAAEQHQQIVEQGWQARKAISDDITVVMGNELEAARLAFVESQGRSIVEQGERALASIREDMKGVELAQWTPGTTTRVSFRDEQKRAVADQGRTALESIRKDVRLVGLGDPAQWKRQAGTDATDWTVATASHPVGTLQD